MKSVANALGPGVDVRGDGGYIVAPPSLPSNGRRYAWDVDAHPDNLPLAPLPRWLGELLEPAACPHSRDHQHTILEGRRNDALTRIAGGLRRIGLSEEAIRAALLVTNEERCIPALDAKEVATIARSVADYPAGPSTPSVLLGQHDQENASSTNEITNHHALVSSVFGVAQNPHLRAEAPIALRIMTWVEHLHNRDPTPDEFYRVSDAQIADIRNRDKAIRSRATIGRAKRRLHEWGLFEVQTRASSCMKEVVNPATGEIASRSVPIKETWIRRDRPLVDKAMQLAAFVRPEPTRQEAAPSKADGGTSRQDRQERGAAIGPGRALDARSMDGSDASV